MPLLYSYEFGHRGNGASINGDVFIKRLGVDDYYDEVKAYLEVEGELFNGLPNYFLYRKRNDTKIRDILSQCFGYATRLKRLTHIRFSMLTSYEWSFCLFQAAENHFYTSSAIPRSDLLWATYFVFLLRYPEFSPHSIREFINNTLNQFNALEDAVRVSRPRHFCKSSI